jgi:protein-S-isoprenylcysteine O-methyltransferase Ste14
VRSHVTGFCVFYERTTLLLSRSTVHHPQVSTNRRIPLGLRAILAFLALPCVFAGLVPLLLLARDPSPELASQWGALPMAVGVAILAGAVRDFFVFGHGTLAPWDPPKKLVVSGLYRYVRNPMYVGITIFLLGWSWLTGSKWLVIYSVILVAAFHLRIILYEERVLARTFPEDWPTYSGAVRRWIPRLSAWNPRNEFVGGRHRRK